MYGLPTNIDLSFFSGATLIQVCVGAHDLILHFDNEISVTIMSSVSTYDTCGNVSEYTELSHAASDVIDFLNQTISSATRVDERTLNLAFDSVGKVAIYDDSSEYESYTIKHRDKLIVV